MKEIQQKTDMLHLARQVVNSTSSHIFLTGKAGTGKTTFLKNLKEATHKKFAVVAPTGIAALNAGGVTIHSQFLFPLGSYIPERKPEGMFGQAGNFFTQQTLISRHPLNSVRKQVLRSIDLLVIDEVSMLRADLLDAIDYRMKSVKGNYQRSFGGVQVLFIGDLFQLPPIVKDHEWSVLKSYYSSLHFFEAQSLKTEPPIYLELDKIFRQEDEKFIRILNHLRNNEPTEEDIKELNTYYKSEKELESEKGVITLTTHNYKADTINRKKLEELPNKTQKFYAEVEGDFPDHLFPIEETLVLKEGAQVMFIKNDTSGEKRYYNGKLAEVTAIKAQSIQVKLIGEDGEFTLWKEEWPNKKYIVNDRSKELEEDIVGTFRQYPIKLAWAVTVHKSQGLTFDKAIIDVGQAFAPGQVYVALSRLRSLEGLILRTRIQNRSLNSDRLVTHFVQRQPKKEKLPELLALHQRKYLEQILALTFDFSPLERTLRQILSSKKINLDFKLERMNQVVSELLNQLQREKNNTETFRKQLSRLLYANDQNNIEIRLQKGSTYYLAFLENLQYKLLHHLAEVELFSKTKTYRTALEEFDQLLMKTLQNIDKAGYVVSCILNQNEIKKQIDLNSQRLEKRLVTLEKARSIARENPELSKSKSGRKKKVKGETYQLTYELIKSGKTIQEVAKERGLVRSTIEGHIAKGIQSGELEIGTLLPQETIDVLQLALRKSDKGIKEIHQAFKGKYSYGQIRMVQASLNR